MDESVDEGFCLEEKENFEIEENDKFLLLCTHE